MTMTDRPNEDTGDQFRGPDPAPAERPAPGAQDAGQRARPSNPPKRAPARPKAPRGLDAMKAAIEEAAQSCSLSAGRGEPECDEPLG